MKELRTAYYAWRVATKFLWWSFVSAFTNSIARKKESAIQLTAFNPREPQDMFDAGFALFTFDWSYGHWRGYHREKPGHEYLHAKYSCDDPKDHPSHKASFSKGAPLGCDIYAIQLEYCDANLNCYDAAGNYTPREYKNAA